MPVSVKNKLNGIHFPLVLELLSFPPEIEHIKPRFVVCFFGFYCFCLFFPMKFVCPGVNVSIVW